MAAHRRGDEGKARGVSFPGRCPNRKAIAQRIGAAAISFFRVRMIAVAGRLGECLASIGMHGIRDRAARAG
jgi:hypothetical protein